MNGSSSGTDPADTTAGPDGSRRRRKIDGGFTLVEMLIVIVLVAALSAVAVVAIGNLTSRGNASACTASQDAAKTGSNIYFASSKTFPTTFVQMTSPVSPSLHLASGVTIDDAGTTASGRGWTLTMTPGVGGLAPSFSCAATGAAEATGATTSTTAASATSTSIGGTAACPGAYAQWTGEYYANQYLTGAPALCRDDAAIGFNWASNGPGGGLPVWRFSARWTRSSTFTAGSHTFTLSSDDGSRLYVDGVLIIDWWSDHTPTFRTVTTSLTAGPHAVVLEYYQFYGSAQVSLSWT
ncbi:MAG: PA14 domain-containing protein [Ilumatobacteraceae bacterium]